MAIAEDRAWNASIVGSIDAARTPCAEREPEAAAQTLSMGAAIESKLSSADHSFPVGSARSGRRMKAVKP
jgi:hypothetical protein